MVSRVEAPSLLFFSSPKGPITEYSCVILQHRQGRALVLAIVLPRAGLGTLTKIGVRCVKEVAVVKVRVGGGGGGGRRKLQPHQGQAPVQDEISPGESSRLAPRGLIFVLWDFQVSCSVVLFEHILETYSRYAWPSQKVGLSMCLQRAMLVSDEQLCA